MSYFSPHYNTLATMHIKAATVYNSSLQFVLINLDHHVESFAKLKLSLEFLIGGNHAGVNLKNSIECTQSNSYVPHAI